jgi:hypothetical protein
VSAQVCYSAAVNFTHKNALVASRIRDRYSLDEIRELISLMQSMGVLDFSPLPTGLFPASSNGESVAGSGYGNVWVRDNVHVAHALCLRGQSSTAAGVACGLLDFFGRYADRFNAIIRGTVDPDDVMNRPNVRFDGATLSEIAGERWSHAQNDALGYFLWLYCRMARAGQVAIDCRALDVLALFPRYFQAIQYWKDRDSGHWEETRKVSASSIGVVVAGLQELFLLVRARHKEILGTAFNVELVNGITDLIEQGRRALDRILPSECVQLSPLQNRRYDAALLFLLYPLSVVDGPTEELILSDIVRFLRGDVGIRRYLGDSYWAPDYEDKLNTVDRTRDYSEDMELRDGLLDQIGNEAQWCIFDPMLSAHYGIRFMRTRSSADFEGQITHLNRSLAHITAETSYNQGRCPELYYLRRGIWTPNPHTPLQWTQANMVVALEIMRRSLACT